MIDPMAKINPGQNFQRFHLVQGSASARGWRGCVLPSRALRRPSPKRRAPIRRARRPLLLAGRRGVLQARALRRPLLQVIVEERDAAANVACLPRAPPVFGVGVLPAPKGRHDTLEAHALRRPLLQVVVEERDATFDRQHR
jgi:hypothetical protein